MGKNPSFPFYPADWIRDTRCLSPAAKGAWIDLLSEMWWAQNRGTLTLPLVGYARVIGATVDQAVTLLGELIDMQICNAFTEQGTPLGHLSEMISQGVTEDVTTCNGKVTLVSRRMEREEKERKSGALRVARFREGRSN